MIMTAINYAHNGYHKLVPRDYCLLSDNQQTQQNNKSDDKKDSLTWYLGKKLLAVV